jgi:hypothetical protein
MSDDTSRRIINELSDFMAVADPDTLIETQHMNVGDTTVALTYNAKTAPDVLLVYNIRWLLRMIRAKGLRAFMRLLRAMAPITVQRAQPHGFGWHRALLRLSHRHPRTSYALAAG